MSGRAVFESALILFVGIIVVPGCDSAASTKSGGGSTMDAMANAVDAQKAAQQQQEQARVEAERKAQAEQQAATEQQPAEQTRRVAGREGVAPGGYANAIIGARRHVLNRVESLAWTQAVQHFQAEHGRLPKDHAEFMSKIVEFHGINLGFKEENQEFLYDPSEGQFGTLYVVEKAEEASGDPATAPQNR